MASLRCLSSLRTIKNVSKLLKFNSQIIVMKPQQQSFVNHSVKMVNYKQKTRKNTNKPKFRDDPETFGNYQDPELSHLKDPNYEAVSQTDFEPLDEIELKEAKRLELRTGEKRKRMIDYIFEIRNLARQKKVKEALELYDHLLEINVREDSTHLFVVVIGICGKVGYTKKAFQVYKQMRDRGLKPTPGALTGLFNSCANCPFPKMGIEKATNLRERMTQEGWHANAITYQSMIKAFGKCGDMSTAFELVDEMKEKKLPITGETFNFLLMSCIHNKEAGFGYAVKVLRKMEQLRIRPNQYTFNLLLRSVRDCQIGPNELEAEIVQDLVKRFNKNIGLTSTVGKKGNVKLIGDDGIKNLKLIDDKSVNVNDEFIVTNDKEGLATVVNDKEKLTTVVNDKEELASVINDKEELATVINDKEKLTTVVNDKEKLATVINDKEELATVINDKEELVTVKHENQVENVRNYPVQTSSNRTVPNEIVAIKPIRTPEDRLTLLGGTLSILSKMESLGLKPDIKTFSMLLVTQKKSTESELLLLEEMKRFNVEPDIDFFNILIKQRAITKRPKDARDVLDLITEHDLKLDIATFGTLALTVYTIFQATKFISDMEKAGFQISVQILGTLADNACYSLDFDLALYVIKKMSVLNLKPDKKMIDSLELARERGKELIYKSERGLAEIPCNAKFKTSFGSFCKVYSTWLKNTTIEIPQHPWKQYQTVKPITEE